MVLLNQYILKIIMEIPQIIIGISGANASSGYRNKDVKNLAIREWTCKSCGTHLYGRIFTKYCCILCFAISPIITVSVAVYTKGKYYVKEEANDIPKEDYIR